MCENMFCGQVIGRLPRKPDTEVREGDILRCKIEEIKYDYSKPILDFDKGTFTLPQIKTIVVEEGVVKYCKDLFEFRIHFYRSDGTFFKRINLHDFHIRSLEVIGNIHDNPELLNNFSKEQN